MKWLCEKLFFHKALEDKTTQAVETKMNYSTVFAEERLNSLTGLYDVWSGKSHGNIK